MLALVKVHDLRKDGKRRVVDHDTTIRVGRMSIIPAGVKRSYDPPVLQPVAGYCPVPHGVVNRFRCIAIIRCFFRLKFVDELPVFLIFRGALRAAHPLGECSVRIRRRFHLKVSLVKPGDIQIQPGILDVAQLGRAHLLVPAAQLRQPVVGQNVGAPLRVRQVFYQHARHLVDALGLGRQHAAMPGDDVPVLVDQHGIDKAKLPQAGSQQRDLRLAVCPRVARVGHQLADRHAQQLLRHQRLSAHGRLQLARPCRAHAFLFHVFSSSQKISHHWENFSPAEGAAVI